MNAARAAFVALLLCFSFAAAADVAVPPLTGRVVDQTGTLSSGDIAALKQTLRDLERRKGSQIAVLVVPTTDQESIEQFSIRVAEAWKIGRKKIDDGALLVDRQERPASADRGRLRPRGRAHRRHLQAHHRRRHHAKIQVRRLCRRHFRRRQPDHPGDRRREAAGAGAGALAQPGTVQLYRPSQSLYHRRGIHCRRHSADHAGPAVRLGCNRWLCRAAGVAARGLDCDRRSSWA